MMLSALMASCTDLDIGVEFIHILEFVIPQSN